MAERRLLRTLTAPLSLEQRSRLDALLQADTALRGATRLSWLRKAPETRTLKTLLFGKVNRKPIVEQWDEMRRVASSIRHGTVSASLLMRKLAAYPHQNQVARALTELGKLERTAFLLEYFRDESLRRRILIGRE
jgi:TnpA family transposase